MTRGLQVFVLIALAACLGRSGLASAADAQQPAPRRIGVLSVSYSPESSEARKFRQGLVDAGYSDGRDVVIEWRSANGDYGRVSQLAADLVHGHALRRDGALQLADYRLQNLAPRRVELRPGATRWNPSSPGPRPMA